MFGLRLPQNFNSPYKAVDPSDFWRRWHISLSSVLRDYLYIPLGGSRHGKLATCKNLMITMLLGGLWHGANWTFIVWGGYHGLLLVLCAAGCARLAQVSRWVRGGVTFLLVIVGWVLFRAENFTMASGLLRRMFFPSEGSMPVGWPFLSATLVVAAVLAHAAPNTFEISHNWKKAAVVLLALLFAACLAVIYGGHPSPFLYFQF